MKSNRTIEDLQEDSLVKAFGKNGNISKVARYGWRHPGEGGAFKMVPKAELMLDLDYQREVRGRSRIVNIASDFNWNIFGVIVVATTENGLYVVDGGHRLRAALLRDDINKLPCMVFDMGGSVEEARAFWAIQVHRRNVTPFDNHKAALHAGIEIAVLGERLIRKHGYEFTASQPRGLQTRAVKTVYWMIERGKNIADRAMDMLAKVAQGTPIGNQELKAIFYIIQMNPGIDFDSFPLNNMISAGIIGVRQEIKRAVLISNSRADYIACAHGLLPLLNKGQRKNRIVLPPMGTRPPQN